MKVSSVQETTHHLCFSNYYDWIYISGKGPISGFRFNIPMNVYLSIQNLSYSDILDLFPGLKMFHEKLGRTNIKGFGKIRRKVKQRDDKIATINLQKIRIRAKSISLNGMVYEFDHELYNILPTFLIPYKRYVADHICKCAAHNRHQVINNSEEFPSTRQTYRWAKYSYHENIFATETGSVVVFDMDEKAYNTIRNRETFRKCKKTRKTGKN